MSYRLLSLLTERASGKLGQRRAHLAAAYSGLQQAAVTNAVAIRNAMLVQRLVHFMPRMLSVVHFMPRMSSALERPTPSMVVSGWVKS